MFIIFKMPNSSKERVDLTNNITNYLLIGLIAVMIVGFTSINYKTTEGSVISEAEGLPEALQSQYTLQDSSGNILSTNAKLEPKMNFVIHIKNTMAYPEHKIDAIKDAIISTETIEVPNNYLEIQPTNGTTTYFKGWLGAGINLRQTFGIADGKPPTVEFVDFPENADVIIIPTDHRSGDGSLGWTNSVIDDDTRKIIRSSITIYQFDQLTSDQIGVIMRHEGGHAVGLGHSTDPKDLMYPTVETEYPYISPCDILGRVAVIYEKTDSDVVCD